MDHRVSNRQGHACKKTRTGPSTFQAETQRPPMRSPGWKKRLPSAFAAVLSLILLLALTSPAIAGLPWEEEEGSPLHAQCWSLGASIGRVEGLSGDLGKLAGPDDGVIILEGIQSNYLTPYTSEEFQLTLIFVNDLSLVQAAYGMRWSTVPFPKVFLRPWVGAYLTLNFLEDQREVDPMSEEEQADGIGIGLAASVGVTMRLGRSIALEAALRGDQIFASGWLDTGDFFAEEFRVRGAYLRLLYFFKN